MRTPRLRDAPRGAERGGSVESLRCPASTAFRTGWTAPQQGRNGGPPARSANRSGRGGQRTAQSVGKSGGSPQTTPREPRLGGADSAHSGSCSQSALAVAILRRTSVDQRRQRRLSVAAGRGIGRHCCLPLGRQARRRDIRFYGLATGEIATEGAAGGGPGQPPTGSAGVADAAVATPLPFHSWAHASGTLSGRRLQPPKPLAVGVGLGYSILANSGYARVRLLAFPADVLSSPAHRQSR